MYDLEFRAALAACPVNPHDVEEVVAGWVSEIDGSNHIYAGFVFRSVSGEFCYVHIERDHKRRRQASSSQWFESEPTHLYNRGVWWEFDREKLNARKEIAKQEAKYPSGGASFRALPGGVVRPPI